MYLFVLIYVFIACNLLLNLQVSEKKVSQFFVTRFFVKGFKKYSFISRTYQAGQATRHERLPHQDSKRNAFCSWTLRFWVGIFVRLTCITTLFTLEKCWNF